MNAFRKGFSQRVTRFIDDNIEESLNDQVPMSEIWDRWVDWCADNRYRHENKHLLGGELAPRFDRKHKNNGSHYIGIKLC